MPGGRYDDRLEHGTMLRITDVQWSDEAEYKCLGENSEGIKSYTISVDVQCEYCGVFSIIAQLISVHECTHAVPTR